MEPKTSIGEQPRARLSPIRGNPEEGSDDDQEGFNSPLNQQGSDFKRIVGTPARKEKTRHQALRQQHLPRKTTTLRKILSSNRVLNMSS